MKMWLNDCKIKETDRFIMCNQCVFLRNANYGRHNLRCLASIFNLRSKHQPCKLGYQYEDNV